MKLLYRQAILCLVALIVITFSWQFVTIVRLRVETLGNSLPKTAAQQASEQPALQVEAPSVSWITTTLNLVTPLVTPTPNAPSARLPAIATPLSLTPLPSACLTLTPEVIFATATAAKAATLQAQSSLSITLTLAAVDGQATAPQSPNPATPPALEQTATAAYAVAATTVAAVMTSVNQPGWQVFTLTPTPTPMMVTATPTPVDAFAAATRIAQMTEEATTTGTATPLPTNWLVLTPILVTETPTPANQATAIQQNALATAQAVTTGTPNPYQYKLAITFVTATPTPPNLIALAQWVVAATQQALTVGTATPTPINWVVITPVVVTNTPTPGNPATAQAQATLGWAIAILTGTPPPHALIVTATPTPGLPLGKDPAPLKDLSTPTASSPDNTEPLTVLFVYPLEDAKLVDSRKTPQPFSVKTQTTRMGHTLFMARAVLVAAARAIDSIH